MLNPETGCVTHRKTALPIHLSVLRSYIFVAFSGIVQLLTLERSQTPEFVLKSVFMVVHACLLQHVRVNMVPLQWILRFR